jgi:thioesterase domain-containing protein
LEGKAPAVSATELEVYLHEHIPLTAAMALRVLQCDEAGIVLVAPLPPNSNHRGTVFGGSLASLATLAAWAVVHTGLRRAGITARVVVQSSQIEYLLPATGEFVATCVAPTETEWRRFLAMVTRKGRGRLTLGVEVMSEGVVAARLTGSFVGAQYDGSL